MQLLESKTHWSIAGLLCSSWAMKGVEATRLGTSPFVALGGKGGESPYYFCRCNPSTAFFIF